MNSYALANSTLVGNGGTGRMPTETEKGGAYYHTIEKKDVPLFSKQLARYILIDLNRVMKKTIEDEIKVTITALRIMVTTRPNEQANRAEGLNRIENYIRKYKDTNTLFAFCLAGMTRYRYDHMMILMSDPKFEKKMMDRIYQMSLDAKKAIDVLLSNLSNGKLPPASEITKAMERMSASSIFKKNPKLGTRTKAWDLSGSSEMYMWMLYSGNMMKSSGKPISFTKTYRAY
jgi:hypothetical protein